MRAVSKKKTKAGRRSDSPSRPASAGLLQPAEPAPVLLAVIGMSPAVLTETIWALAREPEPVVPARVLVVTTRVGRDRLLESLFVPSPQLGGLSPWDALRRDIQSLGVDLASSPSGGGHAQAGGLLRFGDTPDDIRVITAAEPGSGRSRELDDIRSPRDNEAAADFLLEQVRALVENPDTPLIASIAGGRKTMGALLYACMTLIGRETDRLTHVLVSEPYETLRDFWFPTQPGKPPADRQGRNRMPAEARVELADVPFVPLRNLFQKELGRPAGTFSLLVNACRQNLQRRLAETLRVVLHKDKTLLEFDGQSVSTSPREHALLLFLARRLKEGAPPLLDYINALEPLNEFCRELKSQVDPENFTDWRGELKDSPFQRDKDPELNLQDLRRVLSDLRRKLRRRGEAGYI